MYRVNPYKRMAGQEEIVNPSTSSKLFEYSAMNFLEFFWNESPQTIVITGDIVFCLFIHKDPPSAVKVNRLFPLLLTVTSMKPTPACTGKTVKGSKDRIEEIPSPLSCIDSRASLETMVLDPPELPRSNLSCIKVGIK